MIARPLFAVCLAGLSISSYAQISLQGIGDLPGGVTRSSASDLSHDGSVVIGDGRSANGQEAFRWTASGGMVGLGDLAGGSFYSGAGGLTADGRIVVGSSNAIVRVRNSDLDSRTTFRWTQAEGMQHLDVPAFDMGATGISGNGQVVYGGGQGGLHDGTEAFYWTSSTGYVYMGRSNNGPSTINIGASTYDGGMLAGLGTDASGTSRTFTWTQSGGFSYLPRLESAAVRNDRVNDMSYDGSVLVGWAVTGGSQHPTIWTGGTIRDLGIDSGYEFGQLFGVSGDGRIAVGRQGASGGRYESFVWTEETGRVSLATLAQQGGAGLLGWTNLQAENISGDGFTIVGTGTNPLGVQEAFVARIGSVPEPASFVALALGVVAVARRGRKAPRRTSK